MNSRQKRLMQNLADQFGFDLDQTAKGHARFVNSSGQVVFGSGTPSDRRAWKNVRADLKRRSTQQQSIT